nr:MAG TPA: hypothetical protein [Caudoviricetes sp.]DAG55386.1 MAG TPA: hypothetical protein [Caudoviricetes sp.]DAZ79956.1 MAG TPA: hypothetical protein [Caudoviricetes sp.]
MANRFAEINCVLFHISAILGLFKYDCFIIILQSK